MQSCSSILPFKQALAGASPATDAIALRQVPDGRDSAAREKLRFAALNHGRSAELPLGMNLLCFNEPSRSSALRFKGRKEKCEATHKGDRRSRQAGLFSSLGAMRSKAHFPDAPARSLMAGTWNRAVASRSHRYQMSGGNQVEVILSCPQLTHQEPAHADCD